MCEGPPRKHDATAGGQSDDSRGTKWTAPGRQACAPHSTARIRGEGSWWKFRVSPRIPVHLEPQSAALFRSRTFADVTS